MTIIITQSLRHLRRVRWFVRMVCIAAMAVFILPADGLSEDDTFSVFLAGDMIVMRPLSDVEDAPFLKLVQQIREADAAVVHLETLIHRFEGYPQANSGGTYMATSPEIADDLAWAGIDMVSTASNHTFDYGSIGVIENLRNLTEAQIVAAGSGEDLQRARAPKYFRTPKATVALISAASSFVRYGKASRSRPGVHGRPGLNPLRNDEDREANLAAITEASRNADLVVFSMHAHKQGKRLTEFAHQAIDAGADIFLAHGPHEIRGIEIYKDRPIFYSLGDFFFEQHHIERLPSEFFDRFGLGDDATVQDAFAVRYARNKYPDRRKIWEGLGAIVNFEGRDLRAIELIPLDLGFGNPLSERGRPHVASPALGREIIDVAKSKSKRYGTEIVYDPDDNIGLIGNNGPRR